MNTIKHAKLLSLTLGSILIGLTSCKKFLEREPVDSVAETNVFTTFSGLQNAITGAYAGVSAGVEAEIYQTVLVTDEAMLPTENSTGRGVIVFRWQYDPGQGGEATAAFNNFYIAINRINEIIEKVDQVPTLNATEEADKTRIKGEAYALRALSHFELLKTFSVSFSATDLGVTYMEESKIGKPSRNTTGEVFAKVKADLNTALGLIPATFTQNTRITRNGVLSLLAQVALYEKDWDGAINYSSQVISASTLATQAQFQQVWKDQSNAEVIWKIKRVVGEGRIGDTYFDRTQNIIVYAPSKELRDSYDQANDVRYGAYVTDLGGGRYRIGKYTGGDAANPNLADMKVIRLGEIYLVRAEAYAEKNNLASAAADLNALRAARITGYTNQTFATKEALIDAVMNERFKELPFEKSRYFDLKRRLLPITRLPEDAINALGAATLNPTQTKYLMPIPLRERQANPNMQQNPGYE
ncbi:MAG TPA: RagB/SusD family nutrient uptake outer membrane protein [Chitinophagaceae bacterium]